MHPSQDLALARAFCSVRDLFTPNVLDSKTLPLKPWASGVQEIPAGPRITLQGTGTYEHLGVPQSHVVRGLQGCAGDGWSTGF